MSQDETWDAPAKDWDDFVTRLRALRRPIAAEYEAAVGPMVRRARLDLADLEREYAEKVRSAKAKRDFALRQYKDEAHALARWRTATTAAVKGSLASEKAPHLAERRRRLAPVEAWDRRERERLWREKEAPR